MAFDALNANPDKDRKNDNLRDLVKTLLDERKLDVLLKYVYGEMEEQFREILLARARATDAIDNIFYDFLYAYHVMKGPLFMRLGKFDYFLFIQGVLHQKLIFSCLCHV